MEFTIRPVAFVRSPRQELRDDHWGQVESVIELAADLPAESFDGLEEFSHIEVLFVFDRVAEDQLERGARHPRGNEAWPRVGIFAQRAKARPNRLGATIVRLLGREGRQVRVRGLDAIDGTPVVDIKPAMQAFLPDSPVLEPQWAHELMREYWD